MSHRLSRSIAFAVATLTAAGLAHAIGVTDAPHDYVAGYTGSKAGDLDVIGSFVTYNVANDSFVFSGTMDADIGSSPAGLYVWGINRGTGTANFAANGVGGVLFDSVVIFNADGSGSVRTLGAGGSATSFAAGTAAAFGSTIIGKISGALLPSKGYAKTAYTWNLWPRDGTLPAGFGQISDFAPDNSNLPVTVIGSVPEPTSLALFALGLAGLGLRRLGRGRRSEP